MQTRYLFLLKVTLLLTLSTSLFLSCEELEEAVTPAAGEITDEVKEQFLSLGFDPSDLTMEGKDYLVEGDMLISPEALAGMLSAELVTVNHPQGEQYRTRRLVDRDLKTIRVRPTDEGARFVLAIDRAISNFNALGLTFRMVRVPLNTATDIIISRSENSDPSKLGKAEFPRATFGGGRPGGRVDIYARTFDRNNDYVEHVITHELGHCVGLRHTDWYNRDLSCPDGGSEGNSLIGPGAEHIPGTPKKTTAPPDPTSVMNACVRNTTNGEFSRYDRIALQEIY